MSGNFLFLNWLIFVFCLFVFDDRVWLWVLFGALVVRVFEYWFVGIV